MWVSVLAAFGTKRIVMPGVTWLYVVFALIVEGLGLISLLLILRLYKV